MDGDGNVRGKEFCICTEQPAGGHNSPRLAHSLFPCGHIPVGVIHRPMMDETLPIRCTATGKRRIKPQRRTAATRTNDRTDRSRSDGTDWELLVALPCTAGRISKVAHSIKEGSSLPSRLHLNLPNHNHVVHDNSTLPASADRSDMETSSSDHRQVRPVFAQCLEQ